MKTDTHEVTITAGSRKERYQRVRDLLPRGYMILKLYERTDTYRLFGQDKRSRNSDAYSKYEGDEELTRFVAVMRRVKS